MLALNLDSFKYVEHDLLDDTRFELKSREALNFSS